MLSVLQSIAHDPLMLRAIAGADVITKSVYRLIYHCVDILQSDLLVITQFQSRYFKIVRSSNPLGSGCVTYCDMILHHKKMCVGNSMHLMIEPSQAGTGISQYSVDTFSNNISNLRNMFCCVQWYCDA